jgi:hypothetical protein
MSTRGTFEEMLEAARLAGVQVRHASLGGSGGGLATVQGKRFLFVDTDADPEDQLERTVEGLSRVEELRRQPLREDVRRLLGV